MIMSLLMLMLIFNIRLSRAQLAPAISWALCRVKSQYRAHCSGQAQAPGSPALGWPAGEAESSHYSDPGLHLGFFSSLSRALVSGPARPPAPHPGRRCSMEGGWDDDDRGPDMVTAWLITQGAGLSRTHFTQGAELHRAVFVIRIVRPGWVL